MCPRSFAPIGRRILLVGLGVAESHPSGCGRLSPRRRQRRPGLADDNSRLTPAARRRRRDYLSASFFSGAGGVLGSAGADPSAWLARAIWGGIPSLLLKEPGRSRPTGRGQSRKAGGGCGPRPPGAGARGPRVAGAWVALGLPAALRANVGEPAAPPADALPGLGKVTRPATRAGGELRLHLLGWLLTCCGAGRWRLARGPVRQWPPPLAVRGPNFLTSESTTTPAGRCCQRGRSCRSALAVPKRPGRGIRRADRLVDLGVRREPDRGPVAEEAGRRYASGQSRRIDGKRQAAVVSGQKATRRVTWLAGRIPLIRSMCVLPASRGESQPTDRDGLLPDRPRSRAITLYAATAPFRREGRRMSSPGASRSARPASDPSQPFAAGREP